MRQVLGRDTRARIRNSEDDLVIPRGRTYRDTTASLRELDRIADQVLEHLKEPIPITPDIGKIAVHVDSKLERGGSGKWSLRIHRPNDQLTCRQSRWFDGQLPGLHDGDIQEILNQAVHPRGRAVDRFTPLLRTPLGIGAATREGRRVQQNRGQWIPEVMRHGAEHVITELGGIDRGAVETCILDCHDRPVRQRFKARRRSSGP